MTLSQELNEKPKKETPVDLSKVDLDNLLTEGVLFGGYMIKKESVEVKGDKIIAVYNAIPDPKKKRDQLSLE